MRVVNSPLQYTMDGTNLIRHKLPSIHFNFRLIVFLCGNLISPAEGMFALIIDFMFAFSTVYWLCSALFSESYRTHKMVRTEMAIKIMVWFGLVWTDSELCPVAVSCDPGKKPLVSMKAVEYFD